jgi:prepilin-type N-terminal cleavage/methylation domain-containing protein
MLRTKGFTLLELLIVIAIILIIAAIAIPSLLKSRMAAYESAAAAAIRSVNTAQVSYNSSYPTVGFASSLSTLAGTCTGTTVPTSTSACLIDSALASGTRDGYNFTVTGGSGTPNTTYTAIATPAESQYSGVRNFCSFNDAVVRYSMSTITTCDSTVTPLQ